MGAWSQGVGEPMSEGWDRGTRAIYVLGMGLVIVLLSTLFLFYVVPRVVGG